MTPNITITAKGKDLVITIKDATITKGSLSKSGKSNLLATTGGNIDLTHHGIEGGKLGLNIYRPVA